MFFRSFCIDVGDFGKILFSGEEIEKRCSDIAKQIYQDVKGNAVTFLSVLNGSFMFASELLKRYEGDCSIDFIQVSTYGDGTTTSGKFNVKKALTLEIENKDVVIVEDIIDSGFTMVNLLEYLKSFKPASIRICTMIDKPHRRTHHVDCDYKAFTLDKDYFIVGYGLDFAQKYRNFPFIGILKEELYS